MADTITVKFKVMEDGSLKAIGKDADKASAALNKAGTSAEGVTKRNKGVAGATANSTKAFSKMTTGIEGGLVPAYATLAAHVFAITAAFGVLQRNASVAQLNEGIVFTGRAAGQNLPLVAAGLREITDNAISTTDALRSVAVGVSAGFSQGQLEGLTRVAKGASLALGRDMTDAMDRLVRGAAKLEPEILDELGIMVRLDETAQKYAASIGKTAGSLTTFEKRMAFTNAIIDQGAVKFGALNEVIEANPYSKLAAQFDDLLKGLLNVVNVIAGPLVSALASNMGLLVGVVGAFSGGIVRTMIPALTESGIAAAENSEKTKEMAKSQIAASKVYKGAPKVYSNLVAKMKNGTATTEDMQKAQASLTKSIDIHNKQMPGFIKNHGEGSKAVALKRAKLAEATGTLNALTAAQQLETQATIEAARADTLNVAATGNLRDVYRSLTVAIGVEMAATRASTASKGMLSTALAFLRTGFSLAAFSAKAFGIALINAIPIIGQIIFLASLAFEALRKLFSEPPSKMEKAMTNAREALDDFPNILEQMVTTYSMVNTDAERFEISLKAQAGIMQQITDKLKEQIITQRVAKAVEVGRARAAEAMAAVEVQQAETKVQNLGIQKQELTFLQKAMKLYAASNLMRSNPQVGLTLMREVEATDALADSKENLAAATEVVSAAQAKEAIDPSATIANQLEIVSTGIETLKMFVAAQRVAGEENVLAEQNLARLNTMYATLTSGTVLTVAQINEVATAMSATKNAADSAAEGLREVNELAAKSANTTGMFSGEIDALTTNLNNLGKEGETFSIIASKYEEAFKALTGEGTKEAAQDLLRRMKEVNMAKKAEAMIDAQRANNLQVLETAGLNVLHAEMEHGHAVARRTARENELAVTLANKLSTEEEIFAATAAYLKSINDLEKERLALIDARIQKQTRLGGEMFGASAEGAGHMAKNAGTLDDSGTAASDKIKILGDALSPMMQQAAKLGPEGELVAAVSGGVMAMAESFASLAEGPMTFQKGLDAAATAVSALGSMQAAKSKAAIAGIDSEIAAEKARDGKSAGSLAKIAAMEKKKEAMKRKAFEQNKKMQMAQVVMSTANAVMSAIQGPPGLPWSAVFGGMAAAMGAAQLSAISSTSYQGGGSSAGAPSMPSKLSVGSRNASVDLAKGQNAGGELAYARGERGIGSGMTDFKPTSAFAGYKHRAGGGYVVGEQGPELFMPDTPGQIIPSGQGTGGQTNVNFSISTVDATGVEDLLMNQRGNIIGMIREAANEHGEMFLEGVQEKSY